MTTLCDVSTGIEGKHLTKCDSLPESVALRLWERCEMDRTDRRRLTVRVRIIVEKLVPAIVITISIVLAIKGDGKPRLSDKPSVLGAEGL
jgi:hypothetical protein